MTTLAVLSDIHANLPALEAAFAWLDGRAAEAVPGSEPPGAGDPGEEDSFPSEAPAVDGVYHLGDLVGYGPWPDQVVERIRERGIPGVAGNYDSTVAAGYDHCGCRYDDPREEDVSHASYTWTRTHLAPELARWLGALPFRLDLQPDGGHRPGRRVTLVHGTPTLNTLYWHEERSDDFARRMIAKGGVREGDVLVFGHTHRPWHRTVDGVHLVNAGSVGRPKDGDPRACVLLLRLDGDSPGVEHVRVEYDVERAVRAIRSSDLPDALATILETGGRLPGSGSPAPTG